MKAAGEEHSNRDARRDGRLGASSNAVLVGTHDLLERQTGSNPLTLGTLRVLIGKSSGPLQKQLVFGAASLQKFSEFLLATCPTCPWVADQPRYVARYQKKNFKESWRILGKLFWNGAMVPKPV